jgi:hypothetical protein
LTGRFSGPFGIPENSFAITCCLSRNLRRVRENPTEQMTKLR